MPIDSLRSIPFVDNVLQVHRSAETSPVVSSTEDDSWSSNYRLSPQVHLSGGSEEVQVIRDYGSLIVHYPPGYCGEVHSEIPDSIAHRRRTAVHLDFHPDNDVIQ